MICTRSQDGTTFPVFEATANHILDITRMPARWMSAYGKAREMALASPMPCRWWGLWPLKCLSSPGWRPAVVGKRTRPRPRNSGHVTLMPAPINSSNIRAICGLPLGTTPSTVLAVANYQRLGSGGIGQLLSTPIITSNVTSMGSLRPKPVARWGTSISPGHTAIVWQAHRTAKIALNPNLTS